MTSFTRIAALVVFGSLFLGTCRGQEKADPQVDRQKTKLADLLTFKEEGNEVADSKFAAPVTTLLELKETGTVGASKALIDLGRKDRSTILRVLASLRKDAAKERQEAIDQVVSSLSPKLVKSEKRNVDADTAADNLRMGIDTIVNLRAAGVPAGEDGFTNGIPALLEQHDKGSHSASEHVLAIGKVEKDAVVRALKLVRDDPKTTAKRAVLADALIYQLETNKK